MFQQGNDAVARAAARLGSEGQPVRFMCECEDPGCFGPVPLTLSQFRHHRRRNRAILAARHEP
ncbi:MAG TPA: hypothetical protein VD704_11145 [Gaiellaceae bacterium]|nr:hypothetical protein [Gaiellaceae bacterium]